MPSYQSTHRTPEQDPLPIQEQPTTYPSTTLIPSIAETFSAADLSAFSTAEKEVAITALEALDRMDRVLDRHVPSRRRTTQSSLRDSLLIQDQPATSPNNTAAMGARSTFSAADQEKEAAAVAADAFDHMDHLTASLDILHSTPAQDPTPIQDPPSIITVHGDDESAHSGDTDKSDTSDSENERKEHLASGQTADEVKSESEPEPAEEEEEVDYEAQRRRNILQNQQLLLELGLNPVSIHRSFPRDVYTTKDLHHDDDEYKGSNRSSGIAHISTRKYKRKLKPAYQEPVQTRSSKRIRGQPATKYDVDIEALENGLQLELAGRGGGGSKEGHRRNDREDADGQSTAPPAQLGSYSKSLWKGRKQTTGFTVEMVIPCAHTPLTLGSIATTIWEIGTIYKGKENRAKYWSGKGSLFRHPYPIGYKAEKFHFRDRYTMHIKEGPDGPIFIVESASGQVFQGSSPTHPWTKACLASYSKGTRISGPLFFGFSDPITQKMIEDLDGYQTWDEVMSEVRAEENAKLEAEARAELGSSESENDE
ncbi:hypothetical protein BGZ70_006342 [Mortierella alpina]|uniref:FYR N-terminal domain-containing protein n=1 Tax=Mortierella alpina TaxID=64518 RepID=A0A9P6J8C5_MORAP|nr:hypothetical protein BGZ70_006342 [Mortierella alpina]